MVKKMMKMMLCMFMAVALLSGCMRAEESFEVGADGKLKFSAEVLCDKQKMLAAIAETGGEEAGNLSEEQIDALLKIQGYQLITRDGKEYYMMPAGDSLGDISNLKEYYQKTGFLPETDDYMSLTETSFEAAITAGSQALGEDMDEMFDSYVNQANSEMIQKYLEDSEVVISVAFATPIVRTSEGAVLSDDKRAVTFSVSMAETDTKKLYAYCENDITLNGVKSGIIYGKTVTYKIPEGVKATLNGSVVQGTVSSKKTGEYELCLKAPDGTQKSIYYRVDVTPPTLGGVKKNGVYNSKKKVTISDSSNIVKCTLDGKSVLDDLDMDMDVTDFLTQFKYSYNIGRLKEGKHTLKATDKLGNTSSVTFCIDKTAPKITGVKNNKKYKKAVTIKVSDKNGVKSITLNGKKIGNKKRVSKKGTYKVVATDVAGNKKTVKFEIKK